ncbi:non-hydrolyzing UDP-N-acetylglucosamine 2-epimerase [Chromobacterium sp. IIBBL 290-4]|uniref:non-hydrolyzing UDP-N-acetylglucosamine 2-epimerase n=1 Tax=Chromobacterium sp. IIBBL 290-4 TaxID=2953890 RepID=UPI0020B6E1C6|nr:UDP-N-acetylglucosamine 2-epimerase (non-hydrolyzing) [Chromobacterium sp. IIBBL 290-4]UTH74152.1 UDP-N-acetylglucosamine 2-epimerase (non-hydrolyzing) [Chromobacterium sp. IIBBL 290-4]
MQQLDILIICGTRPAIIKLAPLYHALQKTDWAAPCWLHSGQHGELANQMLSSFAIHPDIQLQRQGESLFEFSQGFRAQLEAIMQRRWSLIIVQGDTEDAFIGALAGFYHHIPVAHVEAGLRTHRLDRPFPEEGIRQMISRIARFHFAPTEKAKHDLMAELGDSGDIVATGNTVVDAQRWIAERHAIRRRADGKGHLLLTLHRRENWGHELETLCGAIADIAANHPDLPILFPVHPNPAVKTPVHRLLGHLPNIKLTEPLNYLAMQQALADAWLVMTDSGGLQEEAPTFGAPLLVLREETERPEAVQAGCARIAGTQRERILFEFQRLRDNPELHRAMQAASNPFGDGRACERIVTHLEQVLLACPEVA